MHEREKKQKNEMLKKLVLFCIVTLVLHSQFARAVQSHSYTVNVVYEKIGNFGEIFLQDNPFGMDSLEILFDSDRAREAIDGWKSGKKLQVQYDLNAGAKLLDANRHSYGLIYSWNVDLYFLDKKTSECTGTPPIYPSLLACSQKSIENWGKVISRNYNTLYSLLEHDEKKKLFESQERWNNYREENILMIEDLLDLNGEIYLLRINSLILQMLKNRAEELSLLIYDIRN